MIVPDCMKIWRVLAVLKMTVQYLTGSCAEDILIKEELNRILMFWKVQGFYDRKKINELIDEFERFYDSFFKQE